MVPQRVFQTIRRIRILPILVLASATLPGVAQAQEDNAAEEADGNTFEVSDAVVLDLRPGPDNVRAPSREAFVEALGEHGELRLVGGLELRKTLARSTYSAILEQGKVTLASAALAYGSLDCPSAESRSEQAVLDLSAADASGADARLELRQAYLYSFLCAHKAGHVDHAMAAARILRKLDTERTNPDGRPSEISESTWRTYPGLDAQSNALLVPVSIESEPSGAAIWVDFEKLGTTPDQVFLSAGEHIVAMSSEHGSVSQRITVTSAGTMKLPLHAQKREWIGVAESLDELREAKGPARSEAMRDLMAAVEGQVAFVMREPGRIAVWVLPPQRRGAQLVGHAPHASAAGKLALGALQESSRSPGLDPTMPLLTEDSESSTTASSGRRWWIYGVVLGAAAVGAGLIVAQDLREDRQRIEVSLP